MAIRRLISSARVIDNKICYNIKDANQIYELYYTCFSLHKYITTKLVRMYFHVRVGDMLMAFIAKAIEYMITDALLAAEPYLKVANLVNKLDQYVFLMDNLLNKIEESTEKVIIRFHSFMAGCLLLCTRNLNLLMPSLNAFVTKTFTELSTSRCFPSMIRTWSSRM